MAEVNLDSISSEDKVARNLELAATKQKRSQEVSGWQELGDFGRTSKKIHVLCPGSIGYILGARDRKIPSVANPSTEYFSGSLINLQWAHDLSLTMGISTAR